MVSFLRTRRTVRQRLPTWSWTRIIDDLTIRRSLLVMTRAILFRVRVSALSIDNNMIGLRLDRPILED